MNEQGELTDVNVNINGGKPAGESAEARPEATSIFDILDDDDLPD